MQQTQGSYTVLSGGVGGAKLVAGMAAILPAEKLDVIANTGDDFEHLGLTVCPDIDTLLYTLSGQANPETGWGMANESWQFMDALEKLGGETWFRLGDRDLATHIYRHELLTAGLSLEDATARLRQAMGIRVPLHPMSNAAVRTAVETENGSLAFQDYFVRLQAQPVATAVRHDGSASATPSAGALAALTRPDLRAVVIAPSNPWLSIAPIMSVAGLESSILKSAVPVVAVSPVVAGKAIKGPTAKLMVELGLNPGVTAIAEHYSGVIDGLIIDEQDAGHQASIEKLGIRVGVTNTIMKNLHHKKHLASFVMEFSSKLKGRSR